MKRALVVVDMQNDYFPGGKMALVGVEAAGEKGYKLLKKFRDNDWPVFHIQHLSIQPGATFFLPDSDGAEIHSLVSPQEGEKVIRKHFPNSFRGTPLLDEIRKGEVQQLVVCGAMSHMCIDTTVRAAFDLELNTVVVADACATRDLVYDGQTIAAAQVHGSYMAALAAVFAEVTEFSGLDRVLKRGG